METWHKTLQNELKHHLKAQLNMNESLKITLTVNIQYTEFQ